MKTGIASNAHFFSNVGKPARPPLRTFREFAQEFGVTEAKLRAALAQPGAPTPELIQSNKHSAKNRWYKVKEMRQWWAARTAN